MTALPIATHSGLRGRPGVDLTDAVVARAVAGFVELLARRGLPASIAVARDERPAGRDLAATVVRLLVERGIEAVDFGAVSTPTAKLAARRRGLGGAIVVTGSHLAPDWNGLKFVAAPRYAPVDVRELTSADRPAREGAIRAGSVRSDDGAARDHAAAVCASVDGAAVRGARLRVACTGGAGPVATLVLEGLGCGSPAPHADLGLILDADGDRLRLADERGTVLDEEVTLALVVIAREAADVVKGADTSRMVDDLVHGRGGSVRIVPPGELHLVEALAEGGGDLAGEGNGGVIVPAVGLARDGLAAAASILELRARDRRALSALVADLPAYSRRRSSVPCADGREGRAALERLASRLGAVMDHPDMGVRVDHAEGGWGLVRQSATEPILRVTVEAKTEAAAEKLHAELRAALAGTGGAA